MRKMNTHTPGPWNSIFPLIEEWENGKLIMVFARSTAVASIESKDITTKEQWANARLIASAPDMLEALESVKKQYEDAADNYTTHGIAYKQSNAELKVISAIKKARGNDGVQGMQAFDLRQRKYRQPL